MRAGQGGQRYGAGVDERVIHRRIRVHDALAEVRPDGGRDGGHGEPPGDLPGFQVGAPGTDEGGRRGDLPGRDTGAADVDGHAATPLQRHHLGARRHEVDIATVRRPGPPVALLVERADTDDTGIGRGVRGRVAIVRVAPVTDRGHHGDTPGQRVRDRSANRRAVDVDGHGDIDDLRTTGGRPGDPAGEHRRVRLGGAEMLVGDDTYGQDRDVGRQSGEPDVVNPPGGDHSRHLGTEAEAVAVRRTDGGDRVKAGGHMTGQLGMVGVDTGGEHRDGHPAATREGPDAVRCQQLLRPGDAPEVLPRFGAVLPSRDGQRASRQDEQHKQQGRQRGKQQGGQGPHRVVKD